MYQNDTVFFIALNGVK